MRSKRWFCIVFLLMMMGIHALVVTDVSAYPAASLEGRQKSCLSCHKNTGPWKDESKIVIDIIDPQTGESFKQEDGSFLIEVKRDEVRRVKTVLGVSSDLEWVPEFVAWLYADPEEIQRAPESSLKFAPNWEVNRPFCGKRVAGTVKGFEGKKVATLTMSLRPLKEAKDADISLQVLFKSFDRTLVGNYYERKVNLRVLNDD